MKKLLLVLSIILLVGCSNNNVTKVEQKRVTTENTVQTQVKTTPVKKVFKRNQTFIVEAKEAKEVYLVGDMTKWENEKIRMSKMQGGKWFANVMIEPGKYEYKFLIDGKTLYDNKSTVIEKKSDIEYSSYIIIEPENRDGLVNPDVPHGKLTKLKLKSTIMNNERLVNIYLPPNYNSIQKYPLLLLLHGHGMDADQWTDGGIQNYMDNYINSGIIKPFVIAMPTGESDDFYTGKSEEYIMKEFMPYIKSSYSVFDDRAKVAVCGMSMGGFGAFHLGTEYRNIFGMTVPISIGCSAFEFPRIKNNIKQFPKDGLKISIYCGTDDKIDLGGMTLIELNNEIAKELKENGVASSYKTQSGDHNWDYWGAIAKSFLVELSDFFEGK